MIFYYIFCELFVCVLFNVHFLCFFSGLYLLLYFEIVLFLTMLPLKHCSCFGLYVCILPFFIDQSSDISIGLYSHRLLEIHFCRFSWNSILKWSNLSIQTNTWAKTVFYRNCSRFVAFCWVNFWFVYRY